MIRIITFVVLAAFTMISKTLKAQNTITVTVENVMSSKGKVGFALYTNENFLKVPTEADFAEIKEGKSTFVFKNVPKGVYAISCYHDKNNNSRMDFSPQGMPEEEYGMSNNNVNPFGPPTFNDAKFEVTDKDVSLNIRF